MLRPEGLSDSSFRRICELLRGPRCYRLHFDAAGRLHFEIPTTGGPTYTFAANMKGK